MQTLQSLWTVPIDKSDYFHSAIMGKDGDYVNVSLLSVVAHILHGF